LHKLHSIFLLLSLTLVSCDKPVPPAPAPTPVVQNENVITFVTMNSPNTYFVDGDSEYAGLEYDLAKLFVKELNKDAQYKDTQLKLIVANHIDQILPTVLSGKAHIAAADLTVTEARKNRFNFTQPYHDVQQQLVYNKTSNKKPPKNLAELSGAKITVPSGTSFVERLAKLREQQADLAWEERDNENSENLIIGPTARLNTPWPIAIWWRFYKITIPIWA
jgi:membrane-bound lytic murein transglycosylase F